MSNPKSKAQNRKSQIQNPEPVLSEAEGSKHLYRLLFESAGEAMVVMEQDHDLAWAVMDCNAKAAALLGGERTALLGRTLLDFSPARQPGGHDSDSALRQKIEAALAGEVQHFEWLYRRVDGETFYAQVAFNGFGLEDRLLVQAAFHNIAQYKQAADALKDSEERFRILFENSPDGIVLIDPHSPTADWAILDCNKVFCRMNGYRREELIGQSIDILHPAPADPEERTAYLERLRREGSMTVEAVHCHQDGFLFPIESSTSLISLGGREMVLGIDRDITAQKQAEEALRQASLVVENSPVVLFRWRAAEGWPVQFVSENITRFGYTPEELLSGETPYASIVHPDDLERVGREVQEFSASGIDQFRQEYRIITKDGQVRWTDDRTVIERDAEGNITHYQGIVIDATERRLAEEALAESERRLADIIEFLPSPTFAIDKEGVVIAWNQALAEVTGVKADEILGKGNYEYALPFFGQRRPLLIDLIFESDEEIARLYAHVWRDGSRLHAENSVTARDIERTFALSAGGLYDSQGNLVGAIETFRDITEQKRLEQEIQDTLGSRERQVQLSIDIAQEIALATVEKDLYGRVVSAMMRHLDCSHAQLFRYRTGAPAARVVAGDAKVGSRMLAEDYQIPVGRGSIGTAIATGMPVLQAVIPVDQAWPGHPLLAETRSELAVPIKVGGENIEAQISGLDFFLKQNFDGLAVYPIDPATVRPIARQAIEQGVKVVALHADMGSGGQTALIQLPDRDMGYRLGIEAGHWATAHVPAGETLQLGVLNYRANPQVAEREEGIIEGIEAVFEGKIEIVAAEFATDPSQSMPVAERWLKTYPDLRMIVAINDGGALGAYRAVIAADLNDPDRFFVGGIDATDEALNAIQQGGAFQATVDLKPRDTGVLVVRLLAAASQGKPCPMISPIEPTPVNRSNLALFRQDRQDAVALADALELEQRLVGLDLTGVKLGLSVLNLDNPYFAALARGAREEAVRLGLELVINDPKQVVGALAVQSNEAGALSNEDTLVLAGLSAQLATAFESFRLRQEMADHLNELNALQRLMSREAWQAYQAARTQAAGYLFDQTAVRPVQREELDIATNGQSPAKSPAEAAAETATGHQAMIKPLAVFGESIGTLGIYDDDPDNPLSPEGQTFLDEVAVQVAEALERARLLEQTQASLAETEAQAERLALLSDLGQELARTTTIDDALHAVATKMELIIDSDLVGLGLFDETAQKLQFYALAGDQGASPAGMAVTVADSLFEIVVREQQLLILPDLQLRTESDVPALLEQGMRSGMIAPLVAGGQVVGTVNLASRQLSAYSEQDGRLIMQAASLLASTIDSRRLFEQTQQALAEVEATQRRYTIQAWETYRARKTARRYEQDGEGVSPLGDELPPEVGQAVSQKKPLAVSAAHGLPAGQDGAQTPSAGAKSSLMVPLTVRDEIIGVLGLQETAEERQWTPEEIALVEAIAGQVAQAAEQIRLFDETQQRAAREQRVGEIGDKIRATQSLEEALQVAIREVGLSLKAPQTTVQLEVE